MPETARPPSDPPTSNSRLDGEALRVVELDPTSDPRWAALVEGRKSSVFQSPAWAQVLSATYRFPMRARVVVDEDGTPRAGISYAEVDDFLDPRVSSLPFSDYCDPVVPDAASWRLLVDDLIGRGAQIELRCLHNEIPAADERFALAGRFAWHGADLERDPDEIWTTLHSSARRAIRKADAAGVSVEIASTREQLRAFYDLHLRVRKYKYGLLAQPFAFFANIWTEFMESDNGVLLLAYLNGEPVGGILFLIWQETLYYKFNASQLSTLPARPNDRLIWEGIQIGQRRGLRLLDFGLSDLDQEGLVRYKRKYATSETTITRLRHIPPGRPSAADQAGRQMLGDLTAILVGEDVPDELTARSGDLLYRHFC